MYNNIDLDTIDTTQEPPTEEPARQYYFMAKCREYVRDFEKKNGRRPTFFTQTFGWQMVIQGTFDKYMLRPMNLFFQIVCEKIQFDAAGELLVGIFFVGRAVAKGVVTVTPLKVLLFFVSIIAGSVIYTSVKLVLASIAFWVKDSSPIMTTAYDVADFAKYPVEIYAKPIRIILMTILPFAFVAYIPSTYFLIDANIWKTVAAECGIAVLFWLFSYSLFKKGLTRYESAGS